MDSFSLRTKIIIGQKEVDTVFSDMKKVFIVTDKFMHESGKVSYLTDKFERLGIAYQIFSDVKADPDIDTVTKGVSIILNFQPDAVVAFGGGSAIDAAKATLFFARKQIDMEHTLFVAVPTTSGTGSEVSRFAVISDPEKNAKYPLVEDSLVPDIAILDAELVKSVPPSVTADTGIDVLTHAIEAFVSVRADDFTDAVAEKAIKLVRSYLLRAYAQPDDMQARQSMHNASCLAGIAFSNAGLGLNHGMAHTLGAHFHVPHGRANGILLPYVMAFNAGCYETLTPTAKKYAKIARLLRLESASVRQSAFSMIRAVKQYVAKLHIPQTIKEAGIDKAEFMAVLEEMAEAALADSCTQDNPRICTKEEIKNLFLRAYDGRLM